MRALGYDRRGVQGSDWSTVIGGASHASTPRVPHNLSRCLSPALRKRCRPLLSFAPRGPRKRNELGGLGSHRPSASRHRASDQCRDHPDARAQGHGQPGRDQQLRAEGLQPLGECAVAHLQTGGLPNLLAVAMTAVAIAKFTAAIQAIRAKDFPVVLCVVFIIAIFTLVITLLVDILYAVLDPRLTYR